ncbi:hypothetical protein ANCDUO_20045 [Ancylostoma duodenale]|uniref:Uncharacterized protein n=1 Tax=Ancylostoma duodenale TaxID=51022 RepID=A0A0C2FMT2_9BILA|nr:hypothetical protein ANCDUO_20045 [Ancylostoma duodenale]
MNRLLEIEAILHRLESIDETNLVVNSDWNEIADDIVRVNLGFYEKLRKAEHGSRSMLPAAVTAFFRMLAPPIHVTTPTGLDASGEHAELSGQRNLYDK